MLLVPPIVVFPVRVTFPASDAGPVHAIALPATPVPVTEMASAPIETPLIASVAPLAIVVPPTVEPSADALAAVRGPAFVLVTPAYGFGPRRVMLAPPALVNPPRPLAIPRERVVVVAAPAL